MGAAQEKADEAEEQAGWLTLRRLGAGIEERLLLNGSYGQVSAT